VKANANLFRTLVVLPVVVLVAVALFGVGIRTAETQTTPTYYEVKALGYLPGDTYNQPNSVPYDINEDGYVVGEATFSGHAEVGGTAHAFLYKDGVMTDLRTLGGPSSSARGINDSGQIVGYSDTDPDTWYGPQHAFLYEDGVMKDLGTLGGTSSAAYGINNSGQVVGWSDNSSGESHAFLYEDGVMKDLGTLDGGSRSSASAINNSDEIQIAGAGTYNSIGQTYAFLYDSANGMKGLGTLGGSNSWANGINTSGRVVGAGTYDSDGHYHAFLYKDGKMNDLGTLASKENQMSWANDINDFDQVVGRSDNDVTSETISLCSVSYACYNTAFLYQNGELIDLGTRTHPDNKGIAWNLEAAHGINNKGQIVTEGWWKEADGYTYTYSGLLLTPTSDSPPPADSEAPSAPTISSPQNNTYDSDGSFSISGSAEPGSTVELFEGTTSKGTTTADSSSSGAWSIDLSGVSEGAHTYFAKAKDAAGNTSSASDSVTVTVEDKTAPGGTVSINNGDTRTRSRSVTLTLSATDPSPGSGVTQMRISNTESGLSSASWEAYSTSKAWTLTVGTGTKTVYVQYRDGAGNDSVVVKDTITYKP
jgi:probable HAF family extracellular repeat protein